MTHIFHGPPGSSLVAKALGLVLIAIKLHTTPQVQAGSLIPLAIEQLSESSELILTGTVTTKSCLRDEDNRIYTKIEVDVTEVWKGACKPNSTITIVHGGGQLDGRKTVVSNQVHYSVGEEVVAFLRLNARGEAVTIALCQGKFVVTTDPASGERYVQSVFHGGPPATGGSQKARIPNKLPITVNELRARVATSQR